MTLLNPRQFWKENETKYPILAQIARDIFSIPATGAGVERLFNSARDICHYRRGRLKASTIRDLMLYSRATKFEIEETELAFIRSLEEGEESEKGEKGEIQGQKGEISDNEESESEREYVRESVRSKRKRGVSSEESSDESADDRYLPASRTSGRVRKRPDQPIGFHVIN
jgi:hypothetical protein